MVDDETKTDLKKVVGLHYKPGEGLPKVIVKGSGEQAEKILEKQKTLRSPLVVKDKELLQQLYRLPMDAEIGKELFELVALLLVHVYSIEEKIKGESE